VTDLEISVPHRFYKACCWARCHDQDARDGNGTKSFGVYGRARIREKLVRVYVGSFGSQKQANSADKQHRVAQRAI